MTGNGNLPEKIKKMLADKEPRAFQDSESHYIHAAVLVPLFKNHNRYHILFTERTQKVEHHKGQISFPGGAAESQDKSYEETALREAGEEIGLLPEDVEILGQLDDETTVASQFIVHPFVGLIPYPYEFKINRAEVEKVINVPFRHFLSDDSAHKCSSIDFDDFTYHGTVYLYQGDVIWGATARIMDHFISEIQENIPLTDCMM